MMEDIPFLSIFRFVVMGLAAIVALGLMVSPIQPGAGGVFTPDLVFGLMVYWVVRRPEQAGLVIVFFLGLVSDLILGRPVGLGALTLLISVEILRSQVQILRELNFVFEWLVVMLLLLTTMLIQALLLWITLAPTPGLGAMTMSALITGAFYPFVALVGRYGLALRHRRPGAMTVSRQRMSI